MNKIFINYDGFKILFDYLKNLVNDEIIVVLIELVKEVNVIGLRDVMFKGEYINFIEDRVVYYVVLRNRVNKLMYVDGVNVVLEVDFVLKYMKEFFE